MNSTLLLLYNTYVSYPPTHIRRNEYSTGEREKGDMYREIHSSKLQYKKQKERERN